MRIKKVSQITPVQAHLTNAYSESTQDGYCADYLNRKLSKKAEIVFSKFFSGASDAEYILNEPGLYLIVMSTNGNDSVIVDVAMISNDISYTRIMSDNKGYKTITYSGYTITINNIRYTARLSIIKLD